MLTAIPVCFPIVHRRLNTFFMQHVFTIIFSPVGFFRFIYFEFPSQLHNNLNCAVAKLPKVHLSHPDTQKNTSPLSSPCTKKGKFKPDNSAHPWQQSLETAGWILPHPGQCCRISVKFPISQDIKFDCKEIETSCNLTAALELIKTHKTCHSLEACSEAHV